MTWTIGMPNLGHTMEEGKLAEWLKPVGATVRKGEAIAIVETDKASFDIESPADGALLSIVVEAGATVPIGTTIGLVGETAAASAPSPARTSERPRVRLKAGSSQAAPAPQAADRLALRPQAVNA